MRKLLFAILTFINVNVFSQSGNPELIIGEQRVGPGIVFIFEGAIKDHVMPTSMHLPESETHVHIEARVNWGTNNIPEGAVPGGFIPYLHINAKVVNEKTGLSTFIDLIPHINLIDNFHYARNISLPGSINDLYSVTFNVVSPTKIDLSLHKDWLNNYGNSLISDHSFTYKRISFRDIARARRK